MRSTSQRSYRIDQAPPASLCKAKRSGPALNRSGSGQARLPSRMTMGGQALAAFRRYCAQKKMRYTPEREMIIKEIYRSDRHFNIEHLFSRIRRKNPGSRIAKTSVYRSVPYFLNAGILRESVAHAGQVIYERTLGRLEHDHFRCVHCGRIAEFYSPELEQAQKKICKKGKFQVLWRTNVINGYCERCRQTRRLEPRTIRLNL